MVVMNIEQSLLMAVSFLISRGRPVSIFCPTAQLGQYQPDRVIPPPNEKLRLVIPLPNEKLRLVIPPPKCKAQPPLNEKLRWLLLPPNEMLNWVLPSQNENPMGIILTPK
jgi:hypothetical protein